MWGRCYVDENQFSSGCSEKLNYRKSNENSCFLIVANSLAFLYTVKCVVDKKIQESFTIVFSILNIN